MFTYFDTDDDSRWGPADMCHLVEVLIRDGRHDLIEPCMGCKGVGSGFELCGTVSESSSERDVMNKSLVLSRGIKQVDVVGGLAKVMRDQLALATLGILSSDLRPQQMQVRNRAHAGDVSFLRQPRASAGDARG